MAGQLEVRKSRDLVKFDPMLVDVRLGSGIREQGVDLDP